MLDSDVMTLLEPVWKVADVLKSSFDELVDQQSQHLHVVLAQLIVRRVAVVEANQTDVVYVFQMRQLLDLLKQTGLVERSFDFKLETMWEKT